MIPPPKASVSKEGINPKKIDFRCKRFKPIPKKTIAKKRMKQTIVRGVTQEKG